jgi:multiple sugar transport system substrate-binding protein
LNWYVFEEPSGTFRAVAERCTQDSRGAYRVETAALPADADQQREQLVRRLAARDSDIDLIGMDVIWTAEFAEAGWILPWPNEDAPAVGEGRLAASLRSATYNNRLWAAPFTANAQLLWYRTDRVKVPPKTWDQMIRVAEALGDQGTIQAQGERYEGLTVFFLSLLASAGGTVLDESGQRISLEEDPTRRVLEIMKRIATSSASDPSLSTAREDQARLAFEAGTSAFMVNYSFVWPSVQRNAPAIAAHLGWARWPAVAENNPGRVTIGGVNLGVSAYSRHPELAFRAAACLSSTDNQRIAAERGGLPPTIESLYAEANVRRTFPFADILLETLKNAVQRPQSPMYNDISLAISRTLHPLREIDPDTDLARLRAAIARALRSEGLL